MRFIKWLLDLIFGQPVNQRRHWQVYCSLCGTLTTIDDEFCPGCGVGRAYQEHYMQGAIEDTLCAAEDWADDTGPWPDGIDFDGDQAEQDWMDYAGEYE